MSQEDDYPFSTSTDYAALAALWSTQEGLAAYRHSANSLAQPFQDNCDEALERMTRESDVEECDHDGEVSHAMPVAQHGQREHLPCRECWCQPREIDAGVYLHERKELT